MPGGDGPPPVKAVWLSAAPDMGSPLSAGAGRSGSLQQLGRRIIKMGAGGLQPMALRVLLLRWLVLQADWQCAAWEEGTPVSLPPGQQLESRSSLVAATFPLSGTPPLPPSQPLFSTKIEGQWGGTQASNEE